jgi:hypothetical protein
MRAQIVGYQRDQRIAKAELVALEEQPAPETWAASAMQRLFFSAQAPLTHGAALFPR